MLLLLVDQELQDKEMYHPQVVKELMEVILLLQSDPVHILHMVAVVAVVK
jgi:hypothetical protein